MAILFDNLNETAIYFPFDDHTWLTIFYSLS